MTKQSVGQVVDDLADLGYVERRPDPDDGRAKIVRLTDRGRAAQAVGRQLDAEIERDWSAQIGKRRSAALREGLEALENATHGT